MGKVLLIILFVIIFIILYILVLPFSYDASIRNFDDIGFNISLKTFLRSINAGIDKEDGGDIKVHLKILYSLVQILPKKEKKSDPVSEEKEESVKEDEAKKELDEEPDNKKIADDIENKEALEDKEDKKEKEKKEEDKDKDKEDKANKEDSEDSKKEKTDYIALITDEDNIFAVKTMLSEVLRLLKAYLPKKFYADLTFSAGSPDLTGEIIGGMSLFPFILKNKGRIVPDFLSEDAYFKGYVTLSGKITLGKIITMLLRIVKHKECRNLIKLILGGSKNG